MRRYAHSADGGGLPHQPSLRSAGPSRGMRWSAGERIGRLPSPALATLGRPLPRGEAEPGRLAIAAEVAIGVPPFARFSSGPPPPLGGGARGGVRYVPAMLS